MKPPLLKAVATPYGVHCYTANGGHTQVPYCRGTLNTRAKNAGENFSLRSAQVFRAATARLNCVLPQSFAL